MRPAFPLFIANALAWLGRRADAPALSFATGQTARVALPAARGVPDDGAFHVVAPSGATSTVAAHAGAVSLAFERAGIYEVRDARADTDAAAVRVRVAANLASPAESDLTPGPALRLGARTAPPPDPPRTRGRADVWMLAAGAALLLAFSEWLAFQRRITV